LTEYPTAFEMSIETFRSSDKTVYLFASSFVSRTDLHNAYTNRQIDVT